MCAFHRILYLDAHSPESLQRFISLIPMFLFLIVSIFSTLILAAPGKHRPARGSLGATYFITNKDQNTIIASSINANGTLSFGREIPTGGAGGSASGGADALFTQDSIIQVDGVFFLLRTTADDGRKCLQ